MTTSADDTRTGAAQSKDRPDRILDAALRLFAERGYLATTINDIGHGAGIKGPSVYKHYPSKQTLLHVIMRDTMQHLLDDHEQATSGATSTVDRYRRAAECHARFHTRYRLEAFVGNTEIRNLTGANKSEVLELRARYEHSIRGIVEAGVDEGVFDARSPQLVSYAVLDMGIGVATWFRDDGRFTEDEIAHHYGQFALSMVGVSLNGKADQ
jgi:AcrR family transcriptional regulator